MAEIKDGVKVEIKKRVGLGIEELLLVFLIIINILEFAGLLTFELSYIDNIIDWVCLGYLLYLVSPTELFYGYKDKFVDALFIIAYFSLVMTDFVGFTADNLGNVSAVSDSLLIPFYIFVTQNALTIVTYSIYLGFGILLLIASFNLFMNVEIKEPSILAIFHSPGPAQGMWKKIERTVSSFLLSLIFFFVVFKIVIEWLGWVVDSSIFILALFFYFFFVLKHAKKFDVESILFKLGNVG